MTDESKGRTTIEKIPVRRLLGIVAFAFFAAMTASPAGQHPTPNPLSQHPSSPFEPPAESDPLFTSRQIKALNVERQKHLVSDTEKLLKLTQKLNAEMGADPGDSPTTPQQMRDIAEIERLAKDVKQKMSISIVGVSAPAFRDPMPPSIPQP